MTTNLPYDPVSHLRFNLSLLSLGAELDLSAPTGLKEVAEGALVEAEQLQEQMEERSV